MKANHIGTVIESREIYAQNHINFLASALPVVNEFITAYEVLGDQITQSKLEEIALSGLDGIKVAYNAKVEKQILKSGLTGGIFAGPARNEAKRVLSVLSAKYSNVINMFINLPGYRLTFYDASIPFLLSDFSIIEGRAVLDEVAKQKVREKYPIRITTEEQSDIYQAFLDTKVAFSRFVTLVRPYFTNSPSMSVCDGGGFLDIDNADLMTINYKIFQVLSQQEQENKAA